MDVEDFWHWHGVAVASEAERGAYSEDDLAGVE